MRFILVTVVLLLHTICCCWANVSNSIALSNETITTTPGYYFSNNNYDRTKRRNTNDELHSLATTTASSMVPTKQNATRYPYQPPDWLIHLIQYRQEVFTAYIEPKIISLFGPLSTTQQQHSSQPIAVASQNYSSYYHYTSTNDQSRYIPLLLHDEHTNSVNQQQHQTTKYQQQQQHRHRRLSIFVPSYVKNVKAFKETSMSFATLIMLITTMSFLLLIFLSCFYHNQKTSPLFASPRRHRLPKLVPPPLPVNSGLSWVQVCFLLSDEEIINRIGFDALIFLRFHRLALRCIVKMSIFSFIVLLPLNFTGGGHANAQDIKEYVGSLFFTDFMRFTMANVQGGSPRLWVHCFAAYLLTGIVVRELLIEYEAFNSIRHRYLLSREPHLRTVLVTNIPRHLRSSHKITTYFQNVYPNAVKDVFMCQNVQYLEKIVEYRTSVLARIEKELLLLCRSEKKRLYRRSLWRKAMKGKWWSSSSSSIPAAAATTSSTTTTDGVAGDLAPSTNTTSWCGGCCDFSWCPASAAVVGTTQERLTRLYEELDGLNEAVDKEQHRRARVMRMMDTIGAGEGANDIDYVLATPYASVPPIYEPSRTTYQQQQQQPSAASYLPPPTVQQHLSMNLDDDEVSKTNKNPDTMLRSRSPTSSSVTSNITKDGAKTASTSSNFQPNVQQQYANEPDGIMRDDYNDEYMSKRRKKRKSGAYYSKARRAIRRYGRFSQDVSFLGKPINPSEDCGGGLGGISNSASKRKETIEDHTIEVTDKAFVVMRTFTAATIAIQSMHSSKPGSMQVSTAPEPRDILWNNIYMSKGARRTREYLGEFFVLLIITFYVIPVACVSLLVSESALVSMSPRLAQLAQASSFFSALIALVQPLCMVVIQQLLPPLFMRIGRLEGITAFSEVQMRAFSRYFVFQVINVFLATTIAGSIFDTTALIIENPETAFEMLGNSLPRMSSFFITFVTIKTFFGLGFELVRTMALVQATVRFILFPNATLRTKRQPIIAMRAIDDPGWFPFHKILAQDMLVVVISVVFAVVAPLVTLPCGLFCLLSRIMWTHHHLYVYESVFESGGQFWPKIFRRFVFGLIIAQATITGQFILKDARHEAYATILLMILTYVFLRSTRARYDPTSSTLPLEVATVMDISLRHETEDLVGENGTGSAGSLPATGPTGQNVPLATNITAMSPREQDGNDGTYIGKHDPFRKAYIQPALRATIRARPEQPFPVAQLGSDDFLSKNDSVESTSTEDQDVLLHDSRATVRLRSMSLTDRKLVDRWWNDQLQAAGDQNLFRILIGEECGTLTISGPNLADDASCSVGTGDSTSVYSQYSFV